MLTPQEQRLAVRNVRSLKRAVELMCKKCIYDPAWEPTWRQQVQDCKTTDCPLYNWRPCVDGEARKTGNATRIDPKPRLKLE